MKDIKGMKGIEVVALVLLIVGGLNWGLVALAEFDLVATLTGVGFGQTNLLSRTVYALVGIAAVFEAFNLIALARHARPRVVAA